MKQNCYKNDKFYTVFLQFTWQYVKKHVTHMWITCFDYLSLISYSTSWDNTEDNLTFRVTLSVTHTLNVYKWITF
ncbi:hypothetical protein HMI01_27980 [Halolactibacillus miurensis]|uniref:Uncharacterized protein n=1 Tax=Halolactibacillus miurensis TaxID=306541 RepID=A0ABQ0W266_9BACI|nr:hypothetical protein HMI01_27980 [Halolactibacillus miurensis]